MGNNKKEFHCRKCGKCCLNTMILIDISDTEWIPITEYIKNNNNSQLKIKCNCGCKEVKSYTISSVQDILDAKKDSSSELYHSLSLGQCPFIKKRKHKREIYFCEIYEIRPEMCKYFKCNY